MKYLIYSLFALLPFTSVSIANAIYLIEIPLLFSVLVLATTFHRGVVRITLLDKLVAAYAVITFLSVAVGVESFYESARHFRVCVITSLAIYVVLRFGTAGFATLERGIFFMLPGIFWQGFLLIRYYLLHGVRPVNVEGTVSTITLSLLVCVGLFCVIYGFSKNQKGLLKALRIPLIAGLLCVLFICSSRSSEDSWKVTLWVNISTNKRLRPPIIPAPTARLRVRCFQHR